MEKTYKTVKDIVEKEVGKLVENDTDRITRSINHYEEAMEIEYEMTLTDGKTISKEAVEYFICENGIHITNIILNQDTLVTNKTIVVLPETIRSLPVVAIRPNALNTIRNSGIKSLIVPCSLKAIGGYGVGLYSNYVTERRFPPVKIFYAFERYSRYEDYKCFYSAYCNSIADSLFTYEEKINIDKNCRFICLNRLMDTNGAWEYPDDGKWIDLDGNLYKYTGEEDFVYIDCKKIRSNAFSYSNVKKIQFGSDVCEYDEEMIHDCKKLEEISILNKHPCRVARNAIINCENLRKLYHKNRSWENLDDFYSNCPKLYNSNVETKSFTSTILKEILVLNDKWKYIGARAFKSDKDISIIYIPDTVTRIEDNAFEGSSVKVIILDGNETACDRKWDGGIDEVYVFANANSAIIKSVSSYNLVDNHIFYKDITLLSDALYPHINVDMLKKLCEANMDGKRDDSIMPKPYKWEKEIYKKDYC